VVWHLYDDINYGDRSSHDEWRDYPRNYDYCGDPNNGSFVAGELLFFVVLVSAILDSRHIILEQLAIN